MTYPHHSSFDYARKSTSFFGPLFQFAAFKAKGKAIPLQACRGPQGSRRLRLPEFLDNRHMKLARSAVRSGLLYLPGVVPGTNLCWWLSRPQGCSAAGRIMSVKSSSDHIGNRTRESRPLTYSIFCSAACFQSSFVCILLSAGGRLSFSHSEAIEIIVLHTWKVLILCTMWESRKVLYPGLSYVMCAVVCVWRHVVSYCEKFTKEFFNLLAPEFYI